MDDYAFQAQIHLKSALNFAHEASIKNDQVHELMHNARLESDIASRNATIYFEKMSTTPIRAKAKRHVLPSFWYVPGGAKDYLSDKSISAWDFDSHVPKMHILQRSMNLIHYPLRYNISKLNDFI